MPTALDAKLRTRSRVRMSRESSSVTMNDIAARVGVSQATVSYVLNDRSTGIKVREETRRRILDVAAEMGYRRNDLARAMVTGKTFVFGFLTRNPSEEGASRIMVGAHEEASRNGYLIKLIHVPYGDDFRPFIERAMEQRPAGVLVQNLSLDALECLHSEVSRFNIPVALMDDPPPADWGARVVSDDAAGARAAVEHLCALGHRRIAFVSAQYASTLSLARAAIFRQEMQRAGLPVTDDDILYTDWRKGDVIEREVGALLTRPGPRPTALLCAGDMIAMVAQRAARLAGMTLPRDLSVVGFADFVMATYADPPLTTVAQPFEEIGRVAVRRLLEFQTGSEPASGTFEVPTQLVVRLSTVAPPQE